MGGIGRGWSRWFYCVFEGECGACSVEPLSMTGDGGCFEFCESDKDDCFGQSFPGSTVCAGVGDRSAGGIALVVECDWSEGKHRGS